MFFEQLKLLRTARNLTQTELAKSLHISKQSLSNWENDNVLPSMEAVVSVACYFGVSVDYLLGLDNRLFIEVSGLSGKELSHIQLLIEDLRERGCEQQNRA